MSLNKQIKLARKHLREIPKWMRDLMYWEGTGPFLWDRPKKRRPVRVRDESTG